VAVADLAMQLSDYRDAVCAEAYGGSGYSALDATEQAVVNRIIRSAERIWWINPPLREPHVWTCLQNPGTMTLWSDIAVEASVTVTGVESGGATTLTANTAKFYSSMIGHSITITDVGTFPITGYTSSTVITVSGDATATDKTFSISGDGVYRLPGDYWSRTTRKIIWDQTDGIDHIPFMDKKIVDARRALDASTSFTLMAYIEWVTSDGTAEQAQQLVIWPRAGSNYNVIMPYASKPQGMTDANPYPRGGVEMAEGLLAACIAVAEKERSSARGDRWRELEEMAERTAQQDRTRHHNFIAGLMNRQHHERPFDVAALIEPQ